ncbi:hypothetical protein EVAR_31268_1 [Eumeta japonica]|uniref:Uncharacterized protein n=1 Tax=Eumeta variegata TaxID=151549 RepID=A0A4C1VR38_EUMVA|nr:hypothetical protein EVAR_31268_1 [Eumeta japonica]
MLNTVQRSVALEACRAHQTLSLHSTLTFSKLLPLVTRVKETIWLYEVKHGKDLGNTFVDRELKKPIYYGKLPHPMHLARNQTLIPWTVSP